MAHGSRVCPFCGALNGTGDERCGRCDQRLPGPFESLVGDLYQTALGTEFPMTKLFVGLSLAVFVLMSLLGKKFPLGFGGDARFELSELLRWGAMTFNLDRARAFLEPLNTGSEPWRYASAIFLHFGALHVGFNCLALVDLGRAIEPVIRSGRLVIAFVVTGVVGFVVSHAWYGISSSVAVTGGASGSVFGLVGLMIGLLVARKDPAWKQFAVRVLIYAVIFAVALPVNNAAHAGGFAAGFPLGYLFQKESRPWRRTRALNYLAAALVVACVASLVLCQLSPTWQRAFTLEQAGLLR